MITQPRPPFPNAIGAREVHPLRLFSINVYKLRSVGKEVMPSFRTMSENVMYPSLLMIMMMFVRTNCQCLSNCTIFVDPLTDCEVPPCTGNSSCEYTFTNFSHALEHLDMLCTGDSITIYLMNGDHFIMQHVHGVKISKDVIIQGQSNATINCENIGNDQNVTSLLLFYNSPAVELNNIEFNACQRPIRFNNISKLIISRCVFRNFSNGAVDALDARTFIMSDSAFLDGSTPNDNGNIRADSGGLALRYSQNDIKDFHADIYNCYFINGTAGRHLDIETALASLLAGGINSGLNQNQFTGRGGGMGVYIITVNSSVTVNVRSCSFRNNFAELFGGGLYLYVGGSSSNHSIIVEDSNFINNSVPAAGGAVQMALLIQNLNVPGSQFYYTRCSFVSNSADYGGAVSAIQTYVLGRGNIVSMTECNFDENFSNEKGSAITFASLLYPENAEEPYSYSITNCNFTKNSDPGGVVNLGFYNAEFHGLNRFENNSGPSLRIVGSLIKVSGSLVFRNNDATTASTGASLYISDFGQLEVTEGTTIDFSQNKGEIGAGIYVDLEASPVPYLQLVRNQQCFIIHSNLNLSPNDWKNVNISFSENVAQIGVAIFATSLDLCSWQQDNIFDTSAVVNSSSFNYGENTNTGVSRHFPNNTDKRYYVQTLASKVTINGSAQDNFSARPGQMFTLYVEPIDEFGLVTFAVLRFTDVKDNTRPQSFNPSSVVTSDTQRDPTAIDLVHIDPSLFPFIPSDGYINLTFGLPNFPTQFVDPSIIRDAKVLIEMPFNTKNVEIAHFNLTVLPCRAGFVLREQSNGLVECDCSYVDNIWYGNQIISCNKDTEELIMGDGYWSIAVKRSRWHLQNYQCPITYCMCVNSTDGRGCFNYFNHTNANAQCHPSRTGILCGSCVKNAGVGVLSLTCLKDCHPYAAAISITLLVLWNGVLAIMFLCLSHHFPPELKGILFYIQIAPYATEYFPISVWKHKQYMLYISSFISFYFPVDFCLFPGVDALTVYAVGYIPLLVVIITQLTAVTLLSMFNRTRRYLRKSAAWNGFCTWVYLVYSRYMYSSTNLLSCPVIGDEGDRWFRDGTVKCFKTPGHVFLALLAIVIFTICFALIPLILLIVHKKIKIRAATLYLYGPLTHGYKHSAKWWAAVDLFRRFIMILTLAVLPGRTSVPAGVLFVIFVVYIYVQPYQVRWHNWLETSILLHFIIMLLLRSTTWVLDLLTQYNGIMVPIAEQDLLNNTESTTAWPQSDNAAIFFLIWVYLPLLVVVAYVLYCIGAYLIPNISGYFKKRLQRMQTKSVNNDSVVLHRYVEMKEKSEINTYTISFA